LPDDDERWQAHWIDGGPVEKLIFYCSQCGGREFGEGTAEIPLDEDSIQARVANFLPEHVADGRGEELLSAMAKRRRDGILVLDFETVRESGSPEPHHFEINSTGRYRRLYDREGKQLMERVVGLRCKKVRPGWWALEARSTDDGWLSVEDLLDDV
jgi:hypothetical protein